MCACHGAERKLDIRVSFPECLRKGWDRVCVVGIVALRGVLEPEAGVSLPEWGILVFEP